MNGFVRCILWSGVSSTAGLGMKRICGSGPVLAARYKGPGGGGGGGGGDGGIPEIILLVELGLRELRPCFAQERQQFFLWSRCTLQCLPSRGTRDSRRPRLRPRPFPGGKGFIKASFLRAAGVLVGRAG